MVSSDRLGRQFIAYSLALIPLVISSYLIAGIGIALYGILPAQAQRAEWSGWLVNLLAPSLGGLLVVAGLQKILRRRMWLTLQFRAHFIRALFWYPLAGYIIWLNVTNRDNADWGLVAQVVDWPLVALLAGLAFDLLVIVVRPSDLLPPQAG